jgi:hypothetical protein
MGVAVGFRGRLIRIPSPSWVYGTPLFRSITVLFVVEVLLLRLQSCAPASKLKSPYAWGFCCRDNLRSRIQRPWSVVGLVLPVALRGSQTLLYVPAQPVNGSAGTYGESEI